MKKKNQTTETITREVVESYIFSTVRHDLGIYAERLLLRLVELAQCEVNGLDFKGGTSIGKVIVGEWGHAEIEIPIKDILGGENDTNYEKAKTAVRNLMNKFLEYENDNHYKATQILNDVDMRKKSGKMIIEVNKNIWNAMLDFSKGFRKYELEIATKLRGKYSLRLYKLVSKQSQPMTYSIDELRKMWGITGKYKKDNDFIKYTIQPAKVELDAVSPYTFDYKLNYTQKDEDGKKHRGRPSLSSITFIPLHCIQNESTDTLRKMAGPMFMIEQDITSLLTTKFGFDKQGIRANISLFDIAQKNFDLFEFLQLIAPKALRAENPQGYVIKAVRRYLEQNFDIIITEDAVLYKSKTVKQSPVTRKEPMSFADIFGEMIK